MLLRLGLAKAGMTISDIEVVKMDPSTVVSAFASKQIDGPASGIRWWASSKDRPGLVEVAKSGTISIPRTLFLRPSSPADEVIAGDVDVVRKFIGHEEQRPTTIACRRAALGRDHRQVLGVPAEPTEVESRNGKFLTTAELVAASRDGTVANWLKGFSTNQFVAFGKMQNPRDPKDYYLADLYRRRLNPNPPARSVAPALSIEIRMTKQPNILFIMSDDHAARGISATARA